MSGSTSTVNSAPNEARIEQLRARMRGMEKTVPGRELGTHPALAGVVQLRTGTTYAVDTVLLAMVLLAGPSAAGEWCAVVGEPDFGAEAAAELGVVLDHTILVPEPGKSWLEATAALVDIAALVVVRPPGRVPAATIEKLHARLRSRGTALAVLGEQAWPRAEVRLRVTEPRWFGLGRGEGHLGTRQVTVEVQRGAAPVRRTSLWFPGADGEVRRAAPVGPSGTASAGRSYLEVAG